MTTTTTSTQIAPPTATEMVVLLTGASRGLGLALARLLAGSGASLVLTTRDGSALETAAAALRGQADVLALAGDVADPAHVERLVAAAIGRFGRIDVLVNNASTVGPSPMPALEEYPLGDLERVFRVNVSAPLHLAQRVLPQMRARGSGLVLNVSSDAGVNAYPGWGGYGASKAALEHLSRTLASELAESGVRVYVVDPGDMNTQMHREAEPGMDLSHLPGPEAMAPALLSLIERETAPFGRFEAQALLTQAVGASRVSPPPTRDEEAA